MKKKIFCEKCGAGNPIENNFCFNCGQKIFKEGNHLNNTILKNNHNYHEIKDFLQRLIKSNGYLIITIGDFYVQFKNDLLNNQLYSEAVSSVYEPSVGNKDQEFKKLGFNHDQSSNYYKFISHSVFSTEKIIAEMKTIFESIYNVNFSNYKIESDFEDVSIKQHPKITQETSSNNNQNKKYGCIVIIIIAVIVGIFKDKSGETEKISSNNTEAVVNSVYDGSVYQVENYLKREYLKDPQSYDGIDWSTVQKEDNNSLYKYSVRHKYRAKNSFGGYVIEEKIFYLDKSGNVIKQIDL